MSVSTCVRGFIPQDEKWSTMKAVWNACVAADIQIPDEVLKFFDHEDPNTLEGRLVDISSSVTERSFNSTKCYDVEVSRLPEDVKVVRFELSW